MGADSLDRLSLAKHLEQSAQRKLKHSQCDEAVILAKQARALVSWDGPVDPQRRVLSSAEREIAVSSALIESLALAYVDRKGRAGLVAGVAKELSNSAEIPRQFAVDAELTALHVSEMQRNLEPTMRRLWEVAAELSAEEWSRASALRAYARFIACAVWAEDPESAARGMKEGERLLEQVDDPDARGSYLIWPAQALMRQDEFERAQELLSEALELREGTPRRAITDRYASAYFELKRGDHDEGMEEFRRFLAGTTEAGLLQYARVGLETLSPLF
jgi:tetratricopeptide (TPR) repeat protein